MCFPHHNQNLEEIKEIFQIKSHAYDNHKICPGLSDVVIDSCKNCLEIKVYVVTQMDKSPSYRVHRKGIVEVVVEVVVEYR